MPPKSSTIVRDIHFYRINTGDHPNGKPKVFDPTPVLKHIEQLDWTGDKKNNRYFDQDGKVTGCWIHSTNMPCTLTLGSIRRADLPQMETQGELTPLEIPETAGLVEQTHIVFLDDNIAGCDINFYGPRISRLPYYFSEKAFRVAPAYIRFEPLLRLDMYEQFKKVKRLNVLELRIRSSFVETVRNANPSLGDAFSSAYAAGETDDVELILRPSTNSVSGLSERLLSDLKSLSKRPEIRDEAEKFIVKGYNEETQSLVELNLLSDKLLVKKSIRKLESRSRALNPKAAFDAIISAYQEIKDEIKNAPSIG